ncbi:MAG: hypothetical protein KC561_06065 [Myxococcales bacterium]|nr:hypothetical protein [Myxococcales bacterium]
MTCNPTVKVLSLYEFASIETPTQACEFLHTLCESVGVRGTLILADEGINGTIAGAPDAVDEVLSAIRQVRSLGRPNTIVAWADAIPFRELKVKVKPEIVTFRTPGIDPTQRVGAYVAPGDWNDLISRPEVVVIDTRNDFEVEMGTFRGAVNPSTTSFSEFAEWVRSRDDLTPDTEVAMFCTGGIRCEKATSFMLAQGFRRVYHLKGGILSYFQTVSPDQSLWDGDCFVFDERERVSHTE